MIDVISKFFMSWEVEDANKRLQMLLPTVTENITYQDPRTPETVHGIEALNAYIGMFSANAPGWSAKAIKTDTIGKMSRTTVAFSGKGPDGNEMTQLGQYFVEISDDKVSKMIGFVGTGEVE